MKEAVSIIDTLKLALEALDMMVVPRGFQAQVRIKEIYDTIEEALAQSEQPKVRTGACLLVGVCASEGHKIQKAQPAVTEPHKQSTTCGEPVAWMLEGWGPDCGPYFEIYRNDEMGWRDKKEWTPLYTTPPQHVLMAEHWKSLYEQLKASAYTPDDGTLTADQIKQLKKTAPKRPWVGLTHEDIDKAIEDNQRFGGFRKVGFAYDLEEILKEKNNGE